MNFRAQSLPILLIWPNVATGAISFNSETRIFFARTLALVILQLFEEHSFLNFRRRSLPILFIWPIDATGAISNNSETATTFACALVLVNLPLRSGAILFEFSHVIDSSFIYLA